MQSTTLGCDQESRMTQVESVFKLPRERRNTQINTKQGRKKKEKCHARWRVGGLSCLRMDWESWKCSWRIRGWFYRQVMRGRAPGTESTSAEAARWAVKECEGRMASAHLGDTFGE